jgi:hypothetical protein
VEGDLLGLHFPVLHVDLVPDQDDGDPFAVLPATDSRQVLEPLGDVFVGDPGADIEHDDPALAADVVAFSEPTKLFLAGGVPDVELDRPAVRVENDGVHIDASRRFLSRIWLLTDVLLLELACQVPLDKRGLPDAAVADHDELELGDRLHLLDLLDLLLVQLLGPALLVAEAAALIVVPA